MILIDTQKAKKAEDLTETEIAEIAAAEMDKRHEHLNKLLGYIPHPPIDKTP